MVANKPVDCQLEGHHGLSGGRCQFPVCIPTILIRMEKRAGLDQGRLNIHNTGRARPMMLIVLLFSETFCCTEKRDFLLAVNDPE